MNTRREVCKPELTGLKSVRANGDVYSTGGDSKTLMVVQVSPVEKNVSETMCSLNFAQRVRTVELGQATRKTDTAEVAQLKDRLRECEVSHFPQTRSFYIFDTLFLNIHGTKCQKRILLQLVQGCDILQAGLTRLQ